MLLQACIFIRTSTYHDRNKRNKKPFRPKRDGWEKGFANVKCFGVHDINWIIDGDGDKVPSHDLWNYQLLNTAPGNLATNED